MFFISFVRKSEVSSDTSELSQKNTDLQNQLSSLQAEVDKYKNEVDQFEMVKSDWLMEREALEDVLLQLRKQLQEKETSLDEVLAQKVCEIFSPCLLNEG